MNTIINIFILITLRNIITELGQAILKQFLATEIQNLKFLDYRVLVKKTCKKYCTLQIKLSFYKKITY